MVGTPTCHGN